MPDYSMNLEKCGDCRVGVHCKECVCCIPEHKLRRIMRKVRDWQRKRGAAQKEPCDAK